MNRKKKILLISILCIIAIISIYIFLKGKAYVKASTSWVPQPFKINITEGKMINEYDNIYNVDYKQKLIKKDAEYVYETTAFAKISGENVTFTNYYSGSADCKTKNVQTSQGKACSENNIMAAIINGAELDGVGFMNSYNSGDFYSGAQLAIWEFWNSWVQNSGAIENGFEKSIGNTNVLYRNLEGQSQRKTAQQCAANKEYYANIYFLKYLTQNNLPEINTDNQPNLIYIEILDKNGNSKEPEVIEKVIEDSGISLILEDYNENIIDINDEIVYKIKLYNKHEEEKQNLTINYILPEGVTLISVLECTNNKDIELEENIDYIYDEQTNNLIINIDKIEGKTIKTFVDEATGQIIEYTENKGKAYEFVLKADELEEGTYKKVITNIIKVYKENDLLAMEKNTKTIARAFLEVELESLPENINEKENCVMGLKITNKGLIDAEEVKFILSVPNDISMNTYSITSLSEIGEKESYTEGTANNEFEINSIKIPAQKSVYIQFIGTTNRVDETKQITIEGTVNDEKISWTTTIQNT